MKRGVIVLECFKRKDSNIIDFVKTKIPFKYLKDNTKKFNELMVRLNNEFIRLELFKGDELLKYASDNNLYLNNKQHLLFKHSKGSALINISHLGFKKDNGSTTTLYPAINVENMNFLRGWTYSTGYFSDVYLVEIDEMLSFTTRDNLEIHNIYIHWIISNLEDRLYEFEFNPEVYIEPKYNILNIIEYTNPISLEFDEYIARNQSKRIDKLIVNGVSVKDYIRDVIKYKCLSSEIDIFRCCMIYGKPYKQVISYMDKVLN
ncbi:hypothetical protein JFP838_pA0375 (plasmid) [Clostridium perfringens]|uniref:Uncharacterized protein n=1 Tax=Clostridium perfringens TaxID=1502 RepID=A0A140GRY2_CLOPF|nr:hypothetical protein JFP838_pA0375 [Clostridium perfringens]